MRRRRTWMLAIDRCLLYTSDAADERSSVDLGGRRIIKKKKSRDVRRDRINIQNKYDNDNMATYEVDV